MEILLLDVVLVCGIAVGGIVVAGNEFSIAGINLGMVKNKRLDGLIGFFVFIL